MTNCDRIPFPYRLLFVFFVEGLISERSGDEMIRKGTNKQTPTLEEYKIEVQKFKDISSELGRALKYDEVKIYNLRDSRWYVKHSNNPKVIDFNSFIEYEIGMFPRYNMSKEGIVEYLINLEKELNRPLKKSDLQGMKNNSICISTINSYWGNFNNMKKDIGLAITQENMREKQKSIFKIKRDIVRLCAYVYTNKNRIVIKREDWNLLDIPSYSTCNKYLEKNNSTLREFIESIGFNLVDMGRGYNHLFNDGELIQSQYEQLFTEYLRNLGLIYNKDYFRNVRYATFIENSRCGFDCDYIINYNNETLYVEIAGMLRDYKNYYYENKPIKNKIRENYKNKLKRKENMLKEAGLKYYILFPSDLTEENLNSIFKI